MEAQRSEVAALGDTVGGEQRQDSGQLHSTNTTAGKCRCLPGWQPAQVVYKRVNAFNLSHPLEMPGESTKLGDGGDGTELYRCKVSLFILEPTINQSYKNPKFYPFLGISQ